MYLNYKKIFRFLEFGIEEDFLTVLCMTSEVDLDCEHSDLWTGFTKQWKDWSYCCACATFSPCVSCGISFYNYRELCSVFFLHTCWSLPSSYLICAVDSTPVWYLWDTKHIYSPAILLLPSHGDWTITNLSVCAHQDPAPVEIVFHLPCHSLTCPGQPTPSTPLYIY